MDEATQLGPMVSWAQRDKVLSYIEKGKAEGATLVTGGGIPNNVSGEGYYVQPTVFADVTDGMTIAREEIFGPVMCVLDFDDEAEVIARGNATEFGLSGRRLHRRSDPRPPRRRPAGSRHALDQHLQSLPGRNPLRRFQAIRLRTREFAGGTGALFGAEDGLCRHGAGAGAVLKGAPAPSRPSRVASLPPAG